ncbi:MAG: ABC transporter substrate-binding protein [Bauldia sp.]|nr:ABC transporter substrate-binding protein [Bauldia sp.]
MRISRRSFLPLLGLTVFPRTAIAQAGARPPLVAVIWALPETDTRIPGSITAVQEGLAAQGWIDGLNVRLETRSGGLDTAVARAHAEELAGLDPQVFIAGGLNVTNEIRAFAGSVPIVFFAVVDPVDAGFVQALSRPGGNITGFSNVDASLGGKWLELLRQVDPDLSHAVLMYNPQPGETGTHYLQSFREAAERFEIEGSVVPVESVEQITTAIAAIAATPNGGLVVSTDAFLLIRRREVVEAAARAGVPAIYGYRDYVEEGGLISYSADPGVWLRGVGVYAGRILNGEQAGELPVQFPSVFRLSINMRTAAELGISVPVALLAVADDVVE